MDTKLRLVIVEDIDTDADLIKWHLAKSGLDTRLHRVQTEPDFISALRDLKPDLILSDFSLPQFDGLRALELATVHAPDTPFLFVSGTIGEERAIDALHRGATDYILKSNLSRLSSAVQRALREASLKSEQREQDIRLRRLTRTYRMLSSTSSAILRLRNRGELLDEVCRIAVQQGGYGRVIVSLIDPGTETLRQRAAAGSDSEILHALASVGVAERAMREGSPAVYNDLTLEPTSLAHSEVLIAQGYPAVAALPLNIDGTTIGVITLFSGQRDVFDEAEIDVLLELTANLGFALQYLEKDEAVHFLSYFDSLTGLAKRPLFCQRLARRMSENPADQRILLVVVFDMQKLGAINDSFGRYIGDRLLEKVADRLKQAYADPECVAHFGGGTFAVVHTSDGNGGDTGQLSQNSIARLFVEPFLIEDQPLRLAIRCGIALYPHDADTPDALVQNAEAALRAARDDNEQSVLYGLVTQRATTRSLALEARLAGALDRQEFLLHYQPKVNIDSGRVEGFEALLRWQDSQDGLVPPSIFVPLLERSGAIVDVGEWVLLQAAHDLKRWIAAGMTQVRVAVNVSPLQLRRRDFVDRVLRSKDSAIRHPAGLDIEITESMLMQDIELSIRKLAQLREAGIGVAIDDFGTGYSSLRLLARLPVDTLKVDRSFVQNITDGAKGLTLVSTIVSLAQAFDMRTVAEGVETAEQLQQLRRIECHQAQGFLFARPGPAAEVPSVVARLAQAGVRTSAEHSARRQH